MARFNIYLDDKLHREVCEHIPKRARSRIVQHAYRAALRICADMAKTTDVITSNELIRRIEDEPRAHLSEGAIKEWASDKGHPFAKPHPKAAAKPSLTRVQRAKLADIIEHSARGGLTDETSISFYVNQIVEVINGDD